MLRVEIRQAQGAPLEWKQSWPLGLRDRLLEPATHRIQAQQGPVHAVALAETADGCLAYCIGHTGTLKIFNAKTGSQVLAPLPAVLDMCGVMQHCMSNGEGWTSKG